MKRFSFSNLFFNLLVGFLIGLVLDPTSLSAAILGGTVNSALGFVPRNTNYALMMAVNKEVWLAEIMENFYPSTSFLMRSRDMSAFVENNTIHLASAGVDPGVLVNNTVWPIPYAQRADVPLDLPLDTFDTENTLVRNVEEMEAAYDKMSSVVKGHKNALVQQLAKKAAHAWTPDQNAADTPVLATTGADEGGFKKITLDDIASLKEAFDLLDVPEENRILVLHPTHARQLRAEDRQLFKPTFKSNGVTMTEIEGFQVYIYSRTAVFDKTTGIKAAFGAAPAPATDTISSFAYSENEVCRAMGTMDMFSKLKDPEERGDIVGFQMRAMALPIRDKAMAAIYSAASA